MALALIHVIDPAPEPNPLTLEDLERLRVETRAALERAREDVERLEAQLFSLKFQITQHELFPPRESND